MNTFIKTLLFSFLLSLFSLIGWGQLIDENFDVSSNFPTGWTQNSSYIGTTSSNSHSPTNYIGMNSADDWVQTTQETNPGTLTFWVRTSSDPDNWVLTIQTSSNGTTWTDQNTVTENGTGGTISDTYVQQSITLNLTGNYYVRFYLTSRSAGSCYIDDVLLTAFNGPEIDIQGNGTSIVDGDNTPDLIDYTDFGNADINGGTVVRTYTIENKGTSDLTLGTITIGGTNSGDFTVTSSPASPVTAGNSTSFDITFNPSATGQRDATFSIVNNDSDEDPYNFSIQGTGVEQVDWCNLQWPVSGNIISGDAFNVFAQVYEAGVTEVAGQGANITAWIGYNTTNDDPSNAGWTWVPATYYSDQENNDEYTAEIGSTLPAGTYYYASRFQLSGGVYKYGGYNAGGGGFWDGTTNVSNVLTVDVVDWCNIQSPENGTVALGAGFNVYAQIFEDTYTDPAGQAANISSWIGYSTVDNDPTNSANDADWTWVAANYNTDVGNNDEYILDLENAIGAGGTYYYVSRFQINSGPYAYGGFNTANNEGPWTNTYSSGIGNKSGQLIIQAPTITTSVTSLTGYTYVEGSGPSAEQSFTVEGVYLTDDITVTPPANWEISLTSGGTFLTTPITLTQTGGTVATTTIYTRMISGLLNANSPFSGNITCASSGATTKNVAVDGTVTIPLPNAWINEIHYDNDGTDANEGVEIVIENPGSYALSDFQVDLYNGNGGVTYANQTLNNFTVGAASGTTTIYTLAIAGIQNGAPDGLALSYQGTVIQFLSYEGTFSATDGPANGITSTDIGVSETDGSAPVGNSLQLSGSGCSYGDFTWQPSAANTMGAVNNSQSLCTGSNDNDSQVSASAILTEPLTVSSTVTSLYGVEVFDFTLTDAGSGDGLATIINQLQIKQGNANGVADWTNAIAGAALNGPGIVNLLGTVSATGITFGSPGFISVDDGTSETFTLSIWLKTDLSGISDNDILEFAMNYTDITVDATGSSFGSGAPESGDTNDAIDIVATNLLFTQEPSNTEKDSVMSPNVTVSAVDLNGNTDLDYVGDVTINSTGTMTGDPITVAAVSGTTTFPGIIHTVAGTDLTLSASASGLTSVVSSAFDILEFNYISGDVRPLSAGVDFSWSGTSPYYWEEYDGSSWNSRSVSPQSSPPGRLIINKTGITGGGNSSNTYNDIIIINGGDLTLNDWADAPTALFISAGKSLDVRSGGTLYVQGNFDMDPTANLIVRKDGKMIINEPNMNNVEEMWNGVENFEAGSYVEYQDWQWTAASTNASLVNITSTISNNSQSYKFGNFKLNTTTLGATDWTLIGGGIGTINLCYNDLIINTDGTGFIGGASNQTGTNGFVVNGNMIVQQGNFAFSSTFSADAFNHQSTINGNFEFNGTGTLMGHRNSANTASSNSGFTTLNGNVYISPTATIANDAASDASYMDYNLNGTTAQSVDIGTALNHTNFNVKSGADAKLVADLDLTGTNSVLTIDVGGIWEIMPSVSMTSPSTTVVNNAGASGFIINSDATGTGSLIQEDAFAATCKRYLTGNEWNFIFSPLSTADGSVLTSGGEEAYSYNEVTADYWDATTNYGTLGWITGIDNPLSTSKGYIHRNTSSQLYTLTGGTLETADKTFTLSYTNSGSGSVNADGVTADWDQFEGWNLFGNPYASAIDWDYATGWDKSQIENFVYYYDGTNYKFYGSGTSYSQGISSTGGSQYIPANQGFFVKAKSTGNGQNFTIPKAARVHSNQPFWKNTKVSDPNIVRLNIEKDDFTDEAIVRTLPVESGVTEYHDGDYDAYKMFSWDDTKPQLFSLTDDGSNLFAVNSIPEFSAQKEIPLGVYIGTIGDYNFKMAENTFANTHIWLEDRNLSVNTNLLSSSIYTFTESAETNNDRFFLHFEKNTSPELNATIPDQETLVNQLYEYSLPETNFSDMNFGDSLSFSVTLEDENPLPSWLIFNDEELTFSGTPSNVQVLSIKVTATDIFGASVSDTYKLTVSESSSINNFSENAVQIYPNPAEEIINLVIPNKISSGEIILKDITGKIISIKRIENSINRISVNDLAKGIYVIEIRIGEKIINKKIIKK